jgi:integrase
MNRQQRRSYGTGSLLVHKGAAGKETWYGRWYVGEKRLKRRIGPKRKPGSSKGLTRPQAEAELRRLMVSEQPPPAGSEVPLGIVAEHMLRHLLAIGRKPTTLESYRSILRTHLAPRLADIPISQVTPQEVDALIESMLRNGKGAKTRANALKLLSQTFAFAQRKGWCRENPCEVIDRPRSEPNTDIRSLRLDELVSLLKAIDVSQRPFGWTDRVLFMTAAMTGLRQGELLALRWRDVDWKAHKIRVRRNYVRGHWGTPKSRRGSRAVPLAPSLATELQAHLRRSRFQGYDDLVFGHPETGEVLVHATVGQHFKKALRAAGLREMRFNDLRHTYGTTLAAAGVPMRNLQEWMGHRDIKTTLIYADYEPREGESSLVDDAFS